MNIIIGDPGFVLSAEEKHKMELRLHKQGINANFKEVQMGKIKGSIEGIEILTGDVFNSLIENITYDTLKHILFTIIFVLRGKKKDPKKESTNKVYIHYHKSETEFYILYDESMEDHEIEILFSEAMNFINKEHGNKKETFIISISENKTISRLTFKEHVKKYGRLYRE